MVDTIINITESQVESYKKEVFFCARCSHDIVRCKRCGQPFKRLEKIDCGSTGHRHVKCLIDNEIQKNGK